MLIAEEYDTARVSSRSTPCSRRRMVLILPYTVRVSRLQCHFGISKNSSRNLGPDWTS
jgi:hypothetical protein